jgi:hypothetical protein
MIIILMAAGMRVGNVAAWLMFLVPFFFYCFVVVDPRTHVYTFYPGAAILVGGTLSRLWAQFIHRRRWRYGIAAGLSALYVLCAGYIVLVFVSHRVEYKRAWPASRHPLYPVPFADDELPPYGHFGFPYRAGWKAVEQLFADGTLQGTYASNEEPEITTWYVRSGARTLCDQPDVYVVAQQVQDAVEIDWQTLERQYAPVAQILVGDQPKITVYRRDGEGGPVLTLDARDYIQYYDQTATVQAQTQKPATGAYQVGADFGDVGRLLGYDLPEPVVHRGASLSVTLYWQALTSPRFNYQIFTHVIGPEGLVAQHDGAPACDRAPTSLWELGEVVRDHHTIPIGDEAPIGRFDLYVGMYDLLTLDRLSVAYPLEYSSGNNPGDMVRLTTVEVIE